MAYFAGTPTPVEASSASHFTTADNDRISAPAVAFLISWPPHLGHPAGGEGMQVDEIFPGNSYHNFNVISGYPGLTFDG